VFPVFDVFVDEEEYGTLVGMTLGRENRITGGKNPPHCQLVNHKYQRD